MQNLDEYPNRRKSEYSNFKPIGGRKQGKFAAKWTDNAPYLELPLAGQEVEKTLMRTKNDQSFPWRLKGLCKILFAGKNSPRAGKKLTARSHKQILPAGTLRKSLRNGQLGQLAWVRSEG